MRLGAQSSDVAPGTLAHSIYGDVVTERHRHRYEANVNYLDELRARRPGDLGADAARAPDRDRRAAAGRAPLVHGRAVPPRVQVHALGRSSVVQRIHQGGARTAPGRATSSKHLKVGADMKLCGFDIGLDKPFFLIAGPCVVESEQLQMDTAGTLKEITSALGIPFIFKSSFDKANRSVGHQLPRPGPRQGPGDPGQGQARAGPAGADRRPHRRRHHRGRQGGRRAADAGLPVPPDRLHPRRGAVGQAGEHQEGPVPRAARHEERDRQGARGRRGKGPARRQLHGLRARRELRLQQPRVRHALAGDHARDRRPGGVRRHALGAAAGRPGHQLGRPARDGAGAVARRGGGRRGGPLHGNPSGSGQGAERRPQRRAAQAHEGAARDAAGARPRHQEERFPGGHLSST